MAKTIEEMTMAQIETVLRQRRALKRKAPKLRQERMKILARLAEIDKVLASASPVRSSTQPKKAVRKRAAKSSANNSAAVKSKAAKRPTAKGKKPVSQQLLDFLAEGAGPCKTSEIRKALPHVKPAYIYNLLNQHKKAGKLTHENGKWGVK